MQNRDIPELDDALEEIAASMEDHPDNCKEASEAFCGSPQKRTPSEQKVFDKEIRDEYHKLMNAPEKTK